MKKRFLLFLAALLCAVPALGAASWNGTQVGIGQCAAFTFGAADASNVQPTVFVNPGELAFTAVATNGTAVSVSFYEVQAASDDPAAATGTRLLFTATGNSSSPSYVSTNGGVLDVDINTDGDGGSVKVCSAPYAMASKKFDQFEACRKGALGGDLDLATGLYGWTCGGLYDWAGTGGTYEISCSGDGTATNYTGPGATSCFRSGEKRRIGALHSIGSAIDRTKDGGTVYVSSGVYVDTGCGTLSDGTTRAACPRPYLADRRLRSDFAATGAHTLRFRITADRGITLLGEGNPTFLQASEGDATVTKHRPKYSGTVILNDRGNAGDAGSFGTRTPDGPAQDLQNLGYAFNVGGPDAIATPYCDISTSSADCAEEQNLQELYAPADFYPYGVASSILATTDEANGTICVNDDTSGTTDATYTGVCSLNPLIRCGAAGADIARASHGCGTVGANGYNFGTCRGVVTQMDADLTLGKRMAMAFNVAQCSDNPSANTFCDGSAGNATYIAEQRGALGGACSATGKTLSIGTNGSASTRSWPFPFGDFVTGGGGTNIVRFIDRDRYFLGGTVKNIGFAPANWVGRDSAEATADCLSAADSDVADDEAACDTQTLVGMAEGANAKIEGVLVANASQALSLAAAIDMRGAGVERTIRDSVFSNHRRGTWFDLCDVKFVNNSVRHDAGQEAVAVGAATLAIFCKDTTIAGNRFHTVGGGQNFISQIFPARNTLIEDNTTWNTRPGAGWFYGTAANGLTIRRNAAYGMDGGAPAIDLEIGDSASLAALVMRNVTIRENTFTGRFDTSTSNFPTAAIVVRADGGSIARADDIVGLNISDNLFSSDEVDLCGVWLEDDCTSATGFGGCSAGNDAAVSLVEEAFAEANVSGNIAQSDGTPKAVCMGFYRTSAGHKDATDATEPLRDRFAPLALGNIANDALEEGAWLNGQTAASTPDCDTGGNCVIGTTVKIIDDAAGACAQTTGQLTGGGTTVVTCKWTGAVWAAL